MSQPELCLGSLAPQIRFYFYVFILCVYVCVHVCIHMNAMPMEVRKGYEIPSLL